jgi:hypothetical protein
MGDAAQVDEHAVSGMRPGELDREPGLADATRTEQRDDACRADRSRERPDVAGAPEERVVRQREVAQAPRAGGLDCGLSGGYLLGCPRDAIAQLHCGRARRHAELAAQHLVEVVELEQRGAVGAVVVEASHDLEVGFLVGRVDLDDGVPSLRLPQQLAVQEPHALAWTFCPLLVEVGRQQLALVEREGLAGGVGAPVGERGLRGPGELVDVDRHGRVGEQADEVGAHGDRISGAESPTGVVRRLV